MPQTQIPLWRQIQLRLEDEIAQGLLPPGQRLPAEEELATRFGAHRHTVRRAISRLQDKGMLRAEQGRGTFVQEQILVHRLNRRSKVSSTSERVGWTPSRTVIGVRRVRASRLVATGLDIGIGTLVQRVDTLRLVDARPLVVTSHFYPLPRFDGIGDRIRESGSVTAALRAFGVVDFVHLVSRISARNPSQQDARLLLQPVSRPILQVVNLSVDEANRPVQLTHGRFAASLIELSVRYEAVHESD